MGLYHGWSDEENTHADYIRGGVSPEDFEMEMPRRKKKPKKKSPSKRGCPENEFGPHIYVWEAGPPEWDWWPDYTDTFYERNGFHRREYKICCGCGKRTGSRYTEQMRDLINKKGWYSANYERP